MGASTLSRTQILHPYASGGIDKIFTIHLDLHPGLGSGSLLESQNSFISSAIGAASSFELIIVFSSLDVSHPQNSYKASEAVSASFIILDTPLGFLVGLYNHQCRPVLSLN